MSKGDKNRSDTKAFRDNFDHIFGAKKMSKDEEFSTTIDDVDLDATFEYEPGQKSRTDAAPEDCQEGIDECANLLSVRVCGSIDILPLLSKETMDDLEAQILENYNG